MRKLLIVCLLLLCVPFVAFANEGQTTINNGSAKVYADMYYELNQALEDVYIKIADRLATDTLLENLVSDSISTFTTDRIATDTLLENLVVDSISTFTSDRVATDTLLENLITDTVSTASTLLENMITDSISTFTTDRVATDTLLENLVVDSISTASTLLENMITDSISTFTTDRVATDTLLENLVVDSISTFTTDRVASDTALTDLIPNNASFTLELLSDVPTISGQAGLVLGVNGTEDGFEWIAGGTSTSSSSIIGSSTNNFSVYVSGASTLTATETLLTADNQEYLTIGNQEVLRFYAEFSMKAGDDFQGVTLEGSLGRNTGSGTFFLSDPKKTYSLDNEFDIIASCTQDGELIFLASGPASLTVKGVVNPIKTDGTYTLYVLDNIIYTGFENITVASASYPIEFENGLDYIDLASITCNFDIDIIADASDTTDVARFIIRGQTYNTATSAYLTEDNQANFWRTNTVYDATVTVDITGKLRVLASSPADVVWKFRFKPFNLTQSERQLILTGYSDFAGVTNASISNNLQVDGQTLGNNASFSGNLTVDGTANITTLNVATMTWVVAETPAQSIGNTSWVQFVSYTPGQDTLDEFNETTGVFTPTNTGWYILTPSLGFASNSSGGVRSLSCGTTGTIEGVLPHGQVAPSTSQGTVVAASKVVKMTAGSTVNFQAYQDSGGALNGTLYLTIKRIH